MHSSAYLIKTLTAVALLCAVAAIPLHGRDEDDDRAEAPSAENQPLIQLQIHPNNRTDLCLGQISPGPVENSTLSITDCDYISPNNETAFYSFWTASQSDKADDNPAYGFELRLNGTDLCIDTQYGISNSTARLGRCRDDAPSQQLLYSENRQINVPQTFTCLGVGQYNFPEFQDCIPEQVEQTWTFEAFPGLKQKPMRTATGATDDASEED